MGMILAAEITRAEERAPYCRASVRFAHETGECAHFACFALLAPEEPNACASWGLCSIGVRILRGERSLRFQRPNARADACASNVWSVHNTDSHDARVHYWPAICERATVGP